MAHEDEVVEVAHWSEGIERVHECITGRLRTPEPRHRRSRGAPRNGSLVPHRDGRMSPKVPGERLLLTCFWS